MLKQHETKRVDLSRQEWRDLGFRREPGQLYFVEGALKSIGVTPVSCGGPVETYLGNGNDQTDDFQTMLWDWHSTVGGTTDYNTTKRNTSFVIEVGDGQEINLRGVDIPPGCTIKSSSGAPVPFSDMPGLSSGAVPVSCGPVFRHIFASGVANRPLFQNDRTRGIPRTGGGQQFAHLNLIGLTMVCDRFDHRILRRGDADFIRLQDVFSGNIFGCLGITSAGFGLKLLNANGVRVAHNTFINAPWFLLDPVDSNFLDNQVGGGNGHASDSVWISGDANVGAFITQYQSNIWFNNNSNGIYVSQYAPEIDIVSINTTTDVITLSINVQQAANLGQNWVGETPVVFSTIGTLPGLASGSISASATYFVTVVGPSQIKLSRTWSDRINQVYIDFSSAGSGNKLRVGGNAVLHMNDGAKNNNFGPLRCDQSFGDLILCNGARDNVFEMLNLQYAHMGVGIAEGGYADPVPGPGVRCINSSTGNQFVSGTVDGDKHGTAGAGPSFQKYGFDIDESSRPGTVISPGLNIINHTQANSEAGAAAFAQSDMEPRRQVFAPSEFTGISGTISVGVPFTRRQGLSMSGTNPSAAVNVAFDPSWRKVRARIRWANSTANAGAVTFLVKVAPFDIGATDLTLDEAAAPNMLSATGPTTTLADGGETAVLKETVIPLGTLAAAHYGKLVAMRVVRTDANTGTITTSILQVILEEDR